MKDNILEYLKESDKALSIEEIYLYLSNLDNCDIEYVKKELDSLVQDGTVHQTKKDKYILMANCKTLKTGVIDMSKKGYAFLLQDDSDDIYISKDDLNGAISSDKVLVDTFYKNGKLEGKVLKVLDRKIKSLVGEIKYDNNKPTIILNDKKLNFDIKIENNFKNLVDGHIVLIELGKQISPNKFIGVVKKIIGHKNDPDIDILTIAYKHNIELEFSPLVEEELLNIPEEVREEDKNGRVDLSSDVIFTIDGDDTKDIDDAISIKKTNDYYELGVHIADVSYYVRPNTEIYKAAYSRGTSSYLADRVIPMLPHELSNGICSLNPNVLRLAISCVMKLDYNGKLIDYNIFPSIIKSRKQMTYKNVNKILMENVVPQGYEDYKNDLLTMYELSKILRNKMIKNGYIEFDIPEAKIVQDETGKCIDIIKREQNEGEKLIEVFMIAANETVATHINNMDLPFVYRVHGTPKTEKITDFLNLLKMLKIRVDTKHIDSSSIGMQKLLQELKKYKQFPILSSMLLRSMQKAIYSPNNIGHFGLGLKNYTHFTSPIRRFPDTTVHELLRTYLFNKEINSETVDYYQKYLIPLSEHASLKEQDAIDAEREVVDMKMAEYMQNHIGEEYKGIITTVTNFGFFVMLPNLVEGLVHVNTLKGYYTYNSETLSLVSMDKSKIYKIGDEVKIIVINASKEEGIIDFEVQDGSNK